MRFVSVCIALSFAFACVTAISAAPEDEVYLYQGAPVSALGIALGSWGSGKATESKEKMISGGHSIKITTQGLYAGGRLDFGQPVTLFTDGIDPTRYIVFSLFFTDVMTIEPAAGTIYAYEIPSYTVPRATRLRCVFTSDTGLSLSVEEPIGEVDPDDNWVRVAIPMAKFKLPSDVKEFRLKRLVITSDGPGTTTNPAVMYLGEIKIVKDEEPITIEPLGTQTVMITEDVFFVANARAGVSALKYSWDWDASDGIQEESVGKVGRFVYTRGGEFTVTLTVSDVDGLKKPAKATAKVTVNE